jgi:Flp pilus assembly pilin Flp
VTNLAIRIHARLSTFVASLKEERGQDLVEYAMIGGIVAAALLLGIALLNPAVQNMFTGIGRCIDFQGSTACNPGP